MMTKKPTTKRAPLPRSAKKVGPKPTDKATKAPAKRPTKPKGPTKADTLVALLQRPDGASMAELHKALGTQPHSIRAQISIVRRKRGLTVELAEGRYRAVA
jgi:hypothetical protein